MDEQKVVLSDVRGLGESSTLLDGVDTTGDIWVYHRIRGGDKCAMCGEIVNDGWTCITRDAIVCAKHVAISGKMA